jgi:pilus assembly protein CpaB
MRRSGRLFIVLGVALALIAVLLAIVALTGDDPDDTTSGSGNNEPEQQVVIVVAKREIAAHERLTEDDVSESRVDASRAPAGAVTSKLEVIGMAYADDLTEGQPLMRARLETTGLSQRIPEGMRAYALPVDTINLVGGLIREDDRLDIIFSTRVTLTRVTPSVPFEATDQLTIDTITDVETGEQGVTVPIPGQDIGPTYPYPGEPGSRFLVGDLDAGSPVTKVVLQNVRVIRTVLSPSTDSEGNTTSTGLLVLEVTPEQAEALRFMTINGTYQIMLRGSEDQELATTNGTTFNMMVDELGLPVPKTVRLPEAGTE